MTPIIPVNSVRPVQAAHRRGKTGRELSTTTGQAEGYVSDQNRVITNNPKCAVCDTPIEASGTSIMQFDAGEFLCFCTPSCLKAYRADPEPFRRGERIPRPE